MNVNLAFTSSVAVQLHTFLLFVVFILSACITNRHVIPDPASHLVSPTPFTCSLTGLWPLPPHQSHSLHLVLMPVSPVARSLLVPVYLGPLTSTCPLPDCLVFSSPRPRVVHIVDIFLTLSKQSLFAVVSLIVP